MRLCFISAALLLAVSTAHAASPPSVDPRLTSVVRPDPRTGRLVRTLAVSGAPKAAAKSRQAAWKMVAEKLDDYIRRTAERYDVDPLLVDSVIRAESNYNPFAVSPKGARGLMQLMPGTARRLAVQDSFNPKQNIDGGVRHLKYLLDLYGGQPSPEQLAVAAYNAGEGAVQKYGGVPPYRETTQYVKKVVNGWQAKRAAAPQPPAAEPVPHVVAFTDARGIEHIQTQYAP